MRLIDVAAALCLCGLAATFAAAEWTVSLPVSVSSSLQLPTAIVGGVYIVGDPTTGTIFGVDTATHALRWNVSGFGAIYALTAPVAADTTVVGVRASSGIFLLNSATGSPNATLSTTNAQGASLHVSRRYAVVTEWTNTGSDSTSTSGDSESGSDYTTVVNTGIALASGSAVWTQNYPALTTLADPDDYFYFKVGRYANRTHWIVFDATVARQTCNVTTVDSVFIKNEEGPSFAMIDYAHPRYLNFVAKRTCNVTARFRVPTISTYSSETLTGEWVADTVTYTDAYTFVASVTPSGVAAWQVKNISAYKPRSVFVRTEGTYLQLTPASGDSSSSTSGSTSSASSHRDADLTVTVAKLSAADGTLEWTQRIPTCESCFLEVNHGTPFIVLRNSNTQQAVVIASRFDGSVVAQGAAAQASQLEVMTAQPVSSSKRQYVTVSSTGVVRSWQL